MSTEIHELHDEAYLPRPLVYVIAVTCGALAAMIVQMLLSRAGIELAAAWNSLFSRVPQVRSAGIWWVMVGSAFLISAAVAGILSRLPWPLHRFRLLRWILAGAALFTLAEVGHSPPAAAHGIGVQVGASFIALCAAVFMALFGAFFAARR
jgi:hypothetical protein